MTRYHFRPQHRLRGRRIFAAVFAAGLRAQMGPLRIYAKRSDLSHPRLGLSVARRVGTAVQRNRIKRRLREAFRLTRHDWPGAYDVVVAVRPHDVLALDEYQRLLPSAVAAIHRQWQRRAGQSELADN